MEKVYIYTLEDPISEEIRYVGKANNPINRFKNHLNSARDKNTHKRNWINKLKNDGLKPVLKIIDIIDKSEWIFWERYWISQFKTWGFNLTNCTSGGDGLTYGNQTSFKKGRGAKKVVALDLNGNLIHTFNSGKEAEKFINLSGVSHVISKKYKTCGGYVWFHEENYLSLTDEELTKHLEWVNDRSTVGLGGKETRFKKGNIPWSKGKTYSRKGGKTVFQYSKSLEFINEYPSCAEAARSINGNQDSISNCCRGVSKSASGYIWKYNKIEEKNE